MGMIEGFRRRKSKQRQVIRASTFGGNPIVTLGNINETTEKTQKTVESSRK